MWAPQHLRRARKRLRRAQGARRLALAHFTLAFCLLAAALYTRLPPFAPPELQLSLRAAAREPPVPVAVAPAAPRGPLRSRVDAIVGEGRDAKRGLASLYAIPAPVVRAMSQVVATKLYWKLVYTDVVSALRANHEKPADPPTFDASARVMFIHAQNGLGNRLRAIASGLAMARGTRRVPVVVWERDAHLGAGFGDLFVTSSYGSDIATILYRDLIVMDSFPAWEAVAQRQATWFPVSLMEKDKGKPHALLRYRIPEVQFPLSEPKSLMDSMGAVGDVSASDLRLTRVVDPAESGTSSSTIDPSAHVYFKSAYVARTSPPHLSSRSHVNKELASLSPSEEVMKIARTMDFGKLKNAIGIHIRSRRLENDNVDVASKCEYTRAGAHKTDYWRQQSRLPVFEYKMKVTLQRERRATFFVAADDKATIARLQETFPGRVHAIARDCDDRNPICVRYAMADLLCLSKTRKIFGSNWSSFSEAAGRLGNKRIYLSGRHFGIETRSEKRKRLRVERVWRFVDRLPFIGLLNGCWIQDWLQSR